MLIRLSQPSAMAIPLDAAKAHLRIDSNNTDSDALVTRLIKAETRRYEDFTGRIMSATDFRMTLQAWSDPLIIPAAPVRSVTAVKYSDADHDLQTVDPSNWTFVSTSSGGEIWFESGFSLPTLSTRPDPVWVEFQAGYDDPNASGSGDDPELEAVEADQRTISMMVARIHDHDMAIPDDELRRIAGTRRILR
jgi:uncharacterized phiE125 gp8 family phage protein